MPQSVRVTILCLYPKVRDLSKTSTGGFRLSCCKQNFLLSRNYQVALNSTKGFSKRTEEVTVQPSILKSLSVEVCPF